MRFRRPVRSADGSDRSVAEHRGIGQRLKALVAQFGEAEVEGVQPDEVRRPAEQIGPRFPSVVPGQVELADVSQERRLDQLRQPVADVEEPDLADRGEVEDRGRRR